jgi:putative oxidoreductase
MFLQTYLDVIAFTTRALNALQAPFALAARVYVAWQFLISGWLKATSWENTLFLFREEYHTPVLSPGLAAVLGTTGELGFSALLILGITSRLAAIGLSGVNVMAVVAYAHVLLAQGFEAALAQHVLWGFILLTIAVYGPGALSADGWLTRRGTASPSASAVGRIRAA